MPARDDLGLDRCRQRLIAAALATDPGLAEELELIASRMELEVRREFWHAFADGCARHARPAAAVLGALELTASSRRGDRT